MEGMRKLGARGTRGGLLGLLASPVYEYWIVNREMIRGHADSCDRLSDGTETLRRDDRNEY